MKKYENFICQALFTASLLWLCLLKVHASDSQSYTPEQLTELA
ncbi:MAG: flagella basal body P-ring formation protein FlgA, partial [Alishewanella sp. 34-51-39]